MSHFQKVSLSIRMCKGRQKIGMKDIRVEQYLNSLIIYPHKSCFTCISLATAKYIIYL